MYAHIESCDVNSESMLLCAQGLEGNFGSRRFPNTPKQTLLKSYKQRSFAFCYNV